MDFTTEDFLYTSDEPVTFGVNINNTVDLSATKNGFLLYDYLIPSIGALIILINLAVVISSGLILKKGQQPRSTYLFLGNVAMTDLVTGVAVVLGQVIPVDKRDHYLCACQLGLIVSSTLASVYSVGLIAIDRFLYILYGMQYQKWVYPARARLLIGISWLIGGFIGYLPLMGWYGDIDNGKICWFIVLAPKELVLFTVLVGVIPIILVVILYSIILFNAIKKIIQLQGGGTKNDAHEDDPSSGKIRMFRGNGKEPEIGVEQKKQKGIMRFLKKTPSPSVKAPNKWKAIKVVLFTTGSFVITWSPYFIISLIYVFSCNIDNTTKTCKTMRFLIGIPLAILGFINSFLNPIIYAWWHKGFRSFIKKKVNKVMSKRTRQLQNSNSGTKSNTSGNASNSMNGTKTTKSSSNTNTNPENTV